MNGINLEKKLEVVSQVYENPIRNAKLLGKGGISIIGATLGILALFAVVNVLFFAGALIKIAILHKYDAHALKGLLFMTLVALAFCTVAAVTAYRMALKKLMRFVYTQSQDIVSGLLDIITTYIVHLRDEKLSLNMRSTSLAEYVVQKMPNIHPLAKRGIDKGLQRVPLVGWINTYTQTVGSLDQQTLKSHLLEKTNSYVLEDLLKISNTSLYIYMVANLLVQAVLFYVFT